MARRREDWLELARKLDWTMSYVDERRAFPAAMAGAPWLPTEVWATFDEPFKTTYAEYVRGQHAKEESVRAVREVLATNDDFLALDPAWRSCFALYAATLPLAEFAAVVGFLGAARFGRDSAWRNAALLGGLDELRHAQIPLLVVHDLIGAEPRLDWTHRFLHTNQWIAVAARHLVDEMLFGATPIEMAVATNFVFETGFTNLQFIGMAAVSRAVGDKLFEKMLTSIQTDEARHAQIGEAVMRILVEHDKPYVQSLVDKWLWRSWRFFSVVTGLSMDYLTPIDARRQSFREFVDEWVLGQFDESLARMGLDRPWYWSQLTQSVDYYHHQVYASAYTHRATVWFDMPLPSPDERAWLAAKYPKSWPDFAPIWERVDERWREVGPGVEWHTHGATPLGFCNICQLVLCGGTPRDNSAVTHDHGGRRYVFCSTPCLRIFEQEPERYAAHEDIVQRILTGKAPGNLLSLVREYFGLDKQTWGRDTHGGDYPWLTTRGAP